MPSTPMGANLVSVGGIAGGGVTFRVWGPRATAVYLDGTFGGVRCTGQTADLLLAKDASGYWAGFLPEAAEGDTYRF
jgi:1,4-alpha-glucan branching enzyme